MSLKIGRQAYAEMFGPTTGDRVRLADTELFIEVEMDHTIYARRCIQQVGQTHQISAHNLDPGIVLQMSNRIHRAE